MSYSNGLLQNKETVVGRNGKDGKDGVGFKLTDSGDYNMDKKKIFGLKTQDDIAFESDDYPKDLGSAINKRYLKQNCLTKSKNGIDFDARQGNIHNTENWYPGLYGPTSLVNKQYVDMRDTNVKTEFDTKLTDKADLSTNNEQTFNSIINVPNFDQGYSNMSNVMNKEYIDSRDALKADKTSVLLRNGVNKMFAPLDMNNHYINNVSTPSTHLQASNKAYVDMIALSVLGENKMLANLDMNGHTITNLKQPKKGTDASNKMYVDSYVDSSHITSIDKGNVFNNIMIDSDNQLSEENDIELGDLIHHPNPVHQINKKAIYGIAEGTTDDQAVNYKQLMEEYYRFHEKPYKFYDDDLQSIAPHF
ncbi:hypothetical protein ACROYT_G022589 [Oculina patagonica]